MSKKNKADAKKKKAAERNKRMAEYRNRPHTCGGCRECCYIFPLPGKPARQWCKHITEKGCGVYQTRPPLCRGFQCQYLSHQAKMPKHWRPDRSGVILTYRGHHKGYPILVMTLRNEKVVNTPIVDSIRKALIRSNIIIITTWEGANAAISYTHIADLTRADAEAIMERVLTDNTIIGEQQDAGNAGFEF
jgi:hypothetical protein